MFTGYSGMCFSVTYRSVFLKFFFSFQGDLVAEGDLLMVSLTVSYSDSSAPG